MPEQRTCADCTAVVNGLERYCTVHRAEHRRATARRAMVKQREQRRTAGRCVDCPDGRVVEGKLRCPDCLERARTARERKQAREAIERTRAEREQARKQREEREKEEARKGKECRCCRESRSAALGVPSDGCGWICANCELCGTDETLPCRCCGRKFCKGFQKPG